MSADLAISLTGVSKKYRLFKSPTERLKEALHPFRKNYHREFWALQDVSFDLPKGRTLGVLGLNGSGKSTLLQIVAGVLQPSAGNAIVKGRVAALLELGAGFNPELTGRENVITNALILGLSQSDAKQRMEEVQSFADIGEHFDQPVKTYSSGMFMRVAFAMAITVEPDIMIIDEALAVGDAKFQEKCFRRLKRFQSEGRTILFVTHDRASVTQLCNDAILLHHGRLVARGKPSDVAAIYTELLTTGRLLTAPQTSAFSATQDTAAATDAQQGQVSSGDVAPVLSAFLADRDTGDKLGRNPLYNVNEDRFGRGGARIIDAVVVSDGRINPGHLMSGAKTQIYVKAIFDRAIEAPLLGITITNAQGVTLYSAHSGWLATANAAASEGEVRWYCFTLKLSVVGPWFLDLTVASDPNEVCEVRGRSIVVDVLRSQMFQGLTDLGAAFTEVKT